MDQQFKYYNSSGKSVGMYTWSHPGYSRLNNLEKAAHTIEKYYSPNERGYILISLAHDLINEGKTIAFAAFNSVEQLRGLVFLDKGVREKFQGRYIKRPESEQFVKEFFTIIRGSPELYCLIRRINSRKYLSIRLMIDPESEQITRDDIEAFIRM